MDVVERARHKAAVVNGLRGWAQGSLSDVAAVELLARSIGGRYLRSGSPGCGVCPTRLVLAGRRRPRRPRREIDRGAFASRLCRRAPVSYDASRNRWIQAHVLSVVDKPQPKEFTPN